MPVKLTPELILDRHWRSGHREDILADIRDYGRQCAITGILPDAKTLLETTTKTLDSLSKMASPDRWEQVRRPLIDTFTAMNARLNHAQQTIAQAWSKLTGWDAARLANGSHVDSEDPEQALLDACERDVQQKRMLRDALSTTHLRVGYIQNYCENLDAARAEAKAIEIAVLAATKS